MRAARASLKRVGRAAILLLLGSLLAVTSADVAAAQQPFEVKLPKIGSRVRITMAATGARSTGYLRAVHGDSLLVERPGSFPLVLAQGDLSQVEVRVGEEQAERVGTVLAVAGALGGGAVYVNWCRQNPRECQEDAFGRKDSCDCQEDSRLTVPTLLILGGGLVGWAIGYGLAAPRWKTLGAPTRVGVAPLGTRGVMVGAQLSVGQLGRWRGR